MDTPSVLLSDNYPILDYYIKMKENTESSYSVVYDGSNYLTAETGISSYNGNNLEFTSHNFQIFAVNIIVALFDNSFTENNSNSPSLSVNL